MIIGIDYTKSNLHSGQKTFGKPLHTVSKASTLLSSYDLYLSIAGPSPAYSDLHSSEPLPSTPSSLRAELNPYQRVLKIMSATLAPFDEDGLIPVFGFGDETTSNRAVFPFFPDSQPCNGFAEIIQRYNEVTPKVRLSGPTNFAPIIDEAVRQVINNNLEYTILVIIADGQVNQEKETADAIVRASSYPLSIICVGVGDGPFDLMEEFDDKLPERKFDNFQFVHFEKIMSRALENPEVEFATQALMEIPEQYEEIRRLRLMDKKP